MNARERSTARLVAVLALFVPPAVSAPAGAQLGTTGSHQLEQGVAGLPGSSELSDDFGTAVAAGDFDGDGYDDLAIAAPGETVSGGANRGGEVTIVRGTANGLDPASGDTWSIDLTAFAASAWEDELGSALATGDFDDDGYADLAIGIPNRNVPGGGGTAYDGGAVLVLYGSASGLALGGSQHWHQGTGGVEGVAESYDLFGSSLAGGDFNGDGFDDLAVGVPGEDVGAVEDSGAVNVLYGSPSGLSTDFAAVADQIWTQTHLGSSIEEEGDGFGRTLAAGDFDGDGQDDLAIGSPREDIGPISDAGAVTVLFGTGLGLAATGSRFVTQNLASPAEAESEDWFGHSLAAADLDGDGRDDLAMGSIYEDVEAPIAASAGAVHVLRGSPSGLEATLAWKIDRTATGGSPASFDHVGSALVAGSFGAGPASLVVGAYGVDVNGQNAAGAAFVFAGSSTSAPAFDIQLDQAGSAFGLPEPADLFGAAFAVGDFDGNGFDDLAVGVPGEEGSGDDDAGAVNVFYSTGIFRNGFEGGNAGAWASAIP